MVNLLEDGKPIKMSKRAGNFVTLSEIIEAVGKDVIRFIMLTRRNDQTLDFDFKKVKSLAGAGILLSSYSKFSLCYAFKLVQMEVKCLSIKKFMWYIFCPNHPVEKPDFSSCYIFSNKILPEYHEHIAYCMAFRWQMKDTLDGAYESTSFWQVEWSL